MCQDAKINVDNLDTLGEGTIILVTNEGQWGGKNNFPVVYEGGEIIKLNDKHCIS